MKKAAWKRKIKHACEEAGTYRPYFDMTIASLAEILEIRDRTMEQYIASGRNPVVTHTNKAKEKNIVKNPVLQMYTDLQATALTYWRDLGLTPAGLKRISEEAMKLKKKSALADLLNDGD